VAGIAVTTWSQEGKDRIDLFWRDRDLERPTWAATALARAAVDKKAEPAEFDLPLPWPTGSTSSGSAPTRRPGL
jgi:hypothetical protein